MSRADAGSTRHVLVAFDGTAPSHRALERAAELARPADVVHVISVIDYPEPERAAEVRGHHARLLEDARDLLAADGVDAATVAAEGDTGTEILAAAERLGATLIVVPLDRRRFPHRSGSMAADLVRHAGCDVYVVHVPPEQLSTRPA
jgi:nucleotide-binding universal stress UspA family protein